MQIQLKQIMISFQTEPCFQNMLLGKESDILQRKILCQLEGTVALSTVQRGKQKFKNT